MRFDAEPKITSPKKLGVLGKLAVVLDRKDNLPWKINLVERNYEVEFS